MEIQKLENWIDMPLNHSHELYMQRALELAGRGRGMVSPNPLVGCVVVCNGTIIGEGWHKKYGGPHAEVAAIDSVQDKALLKDSTLYVNLEPCSHHGKTPPCADLVVRHGIQKVVIANEDPNPLVRGNGVKKLQAAGIRVISGIQADAGKALNRRFFTFMEKRRPHVILKWAETSDGFIAQRNNDSKWISDEFSRQLVHKWRAEEDAVLVGSGTVWHDNPTLNVRDWSGRDPVRIVIDRFLKLGPNRNIFDGKQKTICYNLIQDKTLPNVQYIKLRKETFMESLITHLYETPIQSVIVEGGAQVLRAFIEKGFWDEARVFVSPRQFTHGVPAPVLGADPIKEERLMADVLKIYSRDEK